MIAACAVGPGWADSIDEPWGGDWQGTFGSGSHRFQVAFQFWEDFGYYNNLDDGIYNELVSFGAGDGALDGVTPGGGTIHLDYFPRCPVMTGTFTQGAGKDGKQSLMGEGVSYPITLTRGSDRLRPRADKSYSYIPPQDLGDGLVPGDLKEDPARLRRFQALVQGALHGKYRHLHSLLVLNDGKLLLEEYFYGYGPRDPHPVQSVTKSIFSLLVGDAVEKGWLDPDDKLQDLFPGPPVSGDARKGKVTVKDLLTMTSGIDCDDLSRGKGCSWPMVASSDWGSFALSLPMTREPGKHFAYCGACLSILAEALQKQSKLPLLALAQKDLFDPLGIQAPTWWEGPQGAHSPAFGLSLTPRDMAKIGLLVLQKGEWQGQVVVPKEWIEKSTSPQVKDALGKGLDYGYLWWERNVIAHGRTRRVVEAWGVGGQYIFIVPDGGVVVVMTGGDAKDSRASRRCWDLFKRTFDILEGSHKKTRSPLKKGK
ncbi:MAG TPA: serine hydrolase [bacterium]|nr:serine hydrolase [bacterium]